MNICVGISQKLCRKSRICVQQAITMKNITFIGFYITKVIKCTYISNWKVLLLILGI